MARTKTCTDCSTQPPAPYAPHRAQAILIAQGQTSVKVEGIVGRGRAPSVPRTCRAPAEPVSYRVARRIQIARADIASRDGVPTHSGSADFFACNRHLPSRVEPLKAAQQAAGAAGHHPAPTKRSCRTSTATGRSQRAPAVSYTGAHGRRTAECRIAGMRPQP